LCIKCHNEYEDHALLLKKKIADEMNIPIGGCGYLVDKSLFPVRTAGNALLENGDKIPEPRKTELLDRLRAHFGKQEITKEDLIHASGLKPIVMDPNFKSYGQAVVERLENIDDFVQQWRKHFVEVMKPKHLPAFWSVDFGL
jgi:hypothetical protein